MSEDTASVTLPAPDPDPDRPRPRLTLAQLAGISPDDIGALVRRAGLDRGRFGVPVARFQSAL